MSQQKTKLVITAGEPAGIGADICLELKAINNVELYIIADPSLLASRASALQKKIDINICSDTNHL